MQTNTWTACTILHTDTTQTPRLWLVVFYHLMYSLNNGDSFKYGAFLHLPQHLFMTFGPVQTFTQESFYISFSWFKFQVSFARMNDAQLVAKHFYDRVVVNVVWVRCWFFFVYFSLSFSLIVPLLSAFLVDTFKWCSRFIGETAQRVA